MMSEEQLQAEFIALLDRCRGSILRLCLIHTNRQPDNVNDLFQDIVYNLWLSFPKLRNRDKANSWVYGVALNTALMHHRTRRKRPDFVEVDNKMLEKLTTSCEDETIDTLYSLIDQLDDDERNLIFLYIDHVPQKEIAAILHTSEVSVNHRINRLKKKLKKLYENEQ